MVLCRIQDIFPIGLNSDLTDRRSGSNYTSVAELPEAAQNMSTLALLSLPSCLLHLCRWRQNHQPNVKPILFLLIEMLLMSFYTQQLLLGFHAWQETNA